jgi:hypothetical protein
MVRRLAIDGWRLAVPAHLTAGTMCARGARADTMPLTTPRRADASEESSPLNDWRPSVGSGLRRSSSVESSPWRGR